MKMKLLFVGLLLGGAAQAQTTPTTTSPAPVPPTTPAEQIPVPPIGTIDTNTSPLPTTPLPQQDRVRKRQTVMDGKTSPGVENTDGRRPKRANTKKRSANDSKPR